MFLIYLIYVIDKLTHFSQHIRILSKNAFISVIQTVKVPRKLEYYLRQTQKRQESKV